MGTGKARTNMGFGRHGTGQEWLGQGGMGAVQGRAAMGQGRYRAGKGNVGVSVTMRHKKCSDYQSHLWEELSQENSDSL